MALSPEDVIKKSFESAVLKRGYKEQEVDDFLDEIVVELRRVGAENSALSSDLADCRASKGLDPQTTAEPSDRETEVRLEAEEEELARLRRERDELVAEIDELSARAQQQRDVAVEPGTEPESTAVEPGEDAGAIISLAQRLHDEHVAVGQSTKARLIDEAETYRDTTVRETDERNAALIESGQAQHDELVEQGQTTHDRLVSEGAQTREQMVGEAEQRRANVLADLGTQQSKVNATIEELKLFESDYRGRLRALLTEQMQVLDRDAQTT